MTHSRPAIHALLERYGLAARRELGQNFVADPNTVRRIAALAEVGTGDLVVEIGPGLGSLTLALLETGASVTAIELDPGLVVALREIVGEAATVVEADARTVDWDELIGDHTGSVQLVANLPYNIGTTLVIDILENVTRVHRMLVLVQREVADRLAAEPGTKLYGIPSVLVAFHASAEIVGRVPPTVFVPRPKVDSSLVRIVRHDEPPYDADYATLTMLVKTGFGQRRKMLRRALAEVATEDQIAAAGIDPSRRAETVELGEWAALTRALRAS